MLYYVSILDENFRTGKYRKSDKGEDAPTAVVTHPTPDNTADSKQKKSKKKTSPTTANNTNNNNNNNNSNNNSNNTDNKDNASSTKKKKAKKRKADELAARTSYIMQECTLCVCTMTFVFCCVFTCTN